MKPVIINCDTCKKILPENIKILCEECHKGGNQMIQKIIVVSFVIMIFVAGSIGAYNLIQEEEHNYYTWTKAICNTYNECADYEIICLDGEMIDMNQLSDRLYMGDGWVDRRSTEQIEMWCDLK